MPVKLSSLREAFDFVDAGGGLGEMEAYVDRRTGQTWLSIDPSVTGVEEDLPDDLGSDDYVQVPDRRTLGLGKPLALEFARQHLPRDFDDVADMFRRRGAFSQFHSLLARRGMRDAWHAFSEAAEREALLAWCAEEDLAVEED